MDRKHSDPNIWENSIDWDDEADGSDGGYTRHGNYIVPPAMMELVRLRAELAELRKHARNLSEIARMPNAEHVADAHNAAVRAIKAALAAKG